MDNKSFIEYFMTYGWMVLVVAVVGLAIFATVQGEQENQDFNKTELTNLMESQGAYESCEFLDYDNQVDCFNTIDESGNTTYEFMRSFDINPQNDSVVISEK